MLLPVLFIIFLALGPVLTIASLNVVFTLAIPITFKTYFATLWLTLLIGSGAVSNNSK